MTDLVARLKITADAKDVAREAGAAQKAIGGLKTAGGQAKAGLDQAAAGADNFDRRAGGASLQARALGLALGGLSLRAFTGEISDAAFKVQGFTTGLSAVAGGARGAANEQAFLRAESQRLGLVVQEQVASFQNLAGSTNGTALAGEATREIWLGLVEAGTALNRSSEQQGRAMEAVSQIASKGVVSMEELRGQLAEAIPGSFQIAARAMDMTSAQLNKFVGEGKLTADVFLPRFAAQLRKEFGPSLQEAMISPLGDARRELAATKSGLFDLESAAGSEFLSEAKEGLKAFNAELTSADSLEAARNLGSALGQGAAVAAQGAALLVQNLDAIVLAAEALTGIALVRYLSGVATSARQAADAARAKAAAHLAAAQAANAEAQANLAATSSAQRYAAQRVAAEASAARAARNLAAAQSSTAAAMLGLRSAAGGLVSFLGGPWGIAFLAAGAGVSLLASKMAQAEKDAATLQRGLEIVDQHSRGVDDASRALAAGLDIATASARTAAGAAREHAIALYDEEKAAVAAALAVAGKNVAAAKGRQISSRMGTVGANGMVLPAAEGLGQVADQELYRAEQLYDRLLAKNNELQQLGSGRSRGVGGERARLAREEAQGLADASAVVATANTAVADSSDKRKRKSDEVREAERRLARASELQAKIVLDTDLLKERAQAAGQGEAAIEALRVREAGLQAVQQLGVTSLKELSGAQLEAARAVMTAAEANERQAIATEKAERVASTVQQLDRRIASERARTVAITGGTKAAVEFAKAEAVRLEIERTGANLTAEQIALIREKVELLSQLEAVSDNAEMERRQREELELLRLTSREREIELRTRELAIALQREQVDLTEAEARARAGIVAMQQVDAEARAREIGNLREELRRAFIESGELGFDQVGDYVERRLRQAVYDALLAKPIDILINATVGSLDGLTGMNGQGGLLGSILGAGVPGLGGSVGSLLGSAALGTTLGKSMGLGTGKSGTDALLGLGGSILGSSMAAGGALGGIGSAIGMTAFQGSLGLGASVGMAGGLASMLGSAAVLGPLGAIALLGAGTLFKDDKRPYARSDIGVVDGQFAVTGGQALDKGPLDKTNQAASAIAESLNAAADLFKLDLTKIGSGNLASFGYVEGKNTGALGQGYFGGGGGGFSGAEFSGSKDPEKLAADIVKATILKAIEAGASDLSEAEKNVVRQAADLEEAANKIAASRSITQTIDDAIMQIVDPAKFERQQALDAIEANYQAMKAQATELIAAGLATGDILTKLDELRQLQIDAALKRLGQAADDAAGKLKQGTDFRAEINESILKIVDPAAYQLARGTREITAAIEDMRERAQGLIATGAVGPEVLGQIEALRQLQLGELAREVAQSTDAFAQNRKALRAWLDGLNGSASAELSPQAARDAALADYQAMLKRARKGDADALGSITGYADRLLSADRNATDSAQDRLALYNRVRAEVEGLTRMSGGGSAGSDLVAQLKALGLDQLVGLTKASNDNLLATLTPSLAVDLINVPLLKDACGQVAKAETDRLVAAIDRMSAELKAAIEANDVTGLREAVAGMSNELAGLAVATTQNNGRLADMQRDNAIMNAILRRKVA